MINYQDEIRLMCTIMGEFLCDKNNSYGNSAFEPARIFASSDAKEQLRVRIDDKINRIKNKKTHSGDDDLKDLTGYLILLMVAEKLDDSTRS